MSQGVEIEHAAITVGGLQNVRPFASLAFSFIGGGFQPSFASVG
nr:hypothetical protein [Thalassoroseus pseudoceratinae]